MKYSCNHVQRAHAATRLVSWTVIATFLSFALTIHHSARASDERPAPPQDKPIVLFGADIYTVSGEPLRGAQILFENGKITRVGEGHTGYNKGNPCVDAAVETYLLDGTPPQDGLRCE